MVRIPMAVTASLASANRLVRSPTPTPWDQDGQHAHVRQDVPRGLDLQTEALEGVRARSSR